MKIWGGGVELTLLFPSSNALSEAVGRVGVAGVDSINAGLRFDFFFFLF